MELRLKAAGNQATTRGLRKNPARPWRVLFFQSRPSHAGWTLLSGPWTEPLKAEWEQAAMEVCYPLFTVKVYDRREEASVRKCMGWSELGSQLLCSLCDDCDFVAAPVWASFSFL